MKERINLIQNTSQKEKKIDIFLFATKKKTDGLKIFLLFRDLHELQLSVNMLVKSTPREDNFNFYLKVNQWRDDSEAVVTDGFLVRAFDELNFLRVHVVVQGFHALKDVLYIAVLGVVKQNADLKKCSDNWFF